MSDELDEIRSRIRLVDLVSQTVNLKRSGRNWLGLCPFHDDRRPSFSVNDTTGYYKCWSCGESGDLFNWVMKTQNASFGEAVEILAKQAGVTLRKRKAEDPSLKLTWQGAMAEALAFFRAELAKSDLARNYCEGRGIDKEMTDAWEIGYAPDVGEALVVHLQRKQFKLSECQKLFLVDQDPSGGFFDKFRGRLIFPIRDERGELVAFGGRVLGDGHPKYINSSDTPLYRKSRVLYGLLRAKAAIAEGKPPVLCEGYLDVIACHAAGVTTAVASLGTAMSEEHAKLLRRWAKSESVTILYDADEAGERAAARAAELLENEGLRVDVALMPKGQDPDTLLRSAGAAAVREAVEGGLTPTKFKVRQVEAKFRPNDETYWKLIVEALAECRNDLEIVQLIQMLAPKYPDIRDPLEAARALRRMVGAKRKHATAPPTRSNTVPGKPKLGIKSAEATLLRGFMSEEFRREAWEALKDPGIFLTGRAADAGSAISTAFPDAPPAGVPSGWLHLVESEGVRQLLVDLEMGREDRVNSAVFADTLRLLERERLKRAIQDSKASGEGDARLVEIQERLLRLQHAKESQE